MTAHTLNSTVSRILLVAAGPFCDSRAMPCHATPRPDFHEEITMSATDTSDSSAPNSPLFHPEMPCLAGLMLMGLGSSAAPAADRKEDGDINLP